MSRDALREQVDNVLHDISSIKISVLRPDSHPLYQKMIPKHPLVALEIPNKLFLLWSDLKSIKVEKQPSITAASKHLNLLKKSLQDDKKLDFIPPANTLETRLRKECSKVCNKYHGLRGERKERFREGSTLMMVFENEGTLQNSNLVPKLQLNGGLYTDVGQRQQQRKRKQIQEQVKDYASNLQDAGLIPTNLRMQTATGEKVDVNLYPEISVAENQPCEDKTNQMAYLVLKNKISMDCYHEIATQFPSMPRSYKVKECKNDVNVPSITKTPGSFHGAQYKLTELLMEHAEIEVSNDYEFFKETMEIHVKISLDGAQYTRCSTFCLLTLSIFTREYSLSPMNVQTVAIIKAAENYQNLSEGFGDVFKEINELIESPKVTIDGEIYTVIFYLCCDYKMLLELLGLNRANSTYACAWCNASKDQRSDMTKTLADFEKRTIEGLYETQHALLRTEKYKKIRAGRLNDPLLRIPLENVIPDELHLMLRVTDVLTRNLIYAAGTYDSQNGRRGNDILKGAMIKKLLECIRSCGVTFQIYDSATKDFSFTSLVGKDKLKLLEKLPPKLKHCQPGEFYKVVEQLWEEFADLYTILKSKSPTLNADDIQKKAKDWVKLFLCLSSKCNGYQPSCVTPYMHIMVFHMPEVIRRYESLHRFSCQEKKNDEAKKTFFRSSNKWDAAKDILASEYKLNVISCFKRKKRTYSHHDTHYWDGGGIIETRKKRPRISTNNDIIDTITIENHIPS